MHLVVIGFIWPEPQSSAAGQNMLNLLNCFNQQEWQISFCCAAKHSEFEVSLEELKVKSYDIALNCSSFDNLIASLAPDIVIFDRFMIEEQFGWRVASTCPNALRVLNTEDLHSLRGARQQALKSGNPVDLNIDTSYREIASVLRCDLTLLLSKVEIELLKSKFNIASELLHYWPLIPDCDSQSSQPAADHDFSQRHGFVFIGNYRHAPNWDAVLWMRQTLWPQIRTQLPSATLSIYGAYQPPKATQLHAPKLGFLVKGRAPSVTQVMREARVCLAPLRFGAGIKGKLLDAIATATPSVTTTLGAEGIELVNDWPGKIADNADQIVGSAIALHQDQDQWQQASQRCIETAKALFDHGAQRHALIQVLQQALSDIEPRRKRNFMGALLQHHTTASTRYMTQWIEAKNKRSK
jgi:hypothetical protein